MFNKTVDYKEFFPSFVDESVKRSETREIIDEISTLFKNENIYKMDMIHKLTRLIRQLNQFEEIVFLKYVSREERIVIMQNMWNAIINEKVSLNTKIRFANILASHINNYKKLYLSSWWRADFNSSVDLENNTSKNFNCKCDYQVLKKQDLEKDANCICGLIECSFLIDLIEAESTRDYLDSINANSQKTKNYISSLIRVLNSYRPYIQESEIDFLIKKWLSLSTKNISFFVYSKIFLLICNQKYSFNLVNSGKIFEIWDILNGQLLNYWDSLMIVILSRAVKYSWRTNKNLDHIFKKMPFLFEILYSHIGVPILHNVVSNSVNTGATSSTSSVSSGTMNSLTLQPKTPSIIKEVISNEILSILTIKPVNIYNKFAIIFVHLMKSLKILEKNDENSHFYVKVMMNSLISLVNIIYPLNHPSNAGKWSHGISIFVQAITYQYCKRIYRERIRLNDQCNSKKYISDNLLCRFDDEYIMSILFPLMEQGIYSKDSQIAGRYEDSLKRWTYILPDILLSYLLNVKIIPALESNTETHQIYIAFRLLTTITPLIIQFIPESIPRFLEISLQGIDISDPMKINQTLFFYTILFYNSQNLNVKMFDYDEYETTKKLSSLLNNEVINLDEIKSSFTLYNYPKDIDYSDASLQNKDKIPKSIMEYTNINGKSPLDLYFQQSSDELNCIIEGSRKSDFYFILNNKFTQEILLEQMEHRKLLIETIFNYWIFQFLDKVLNLLENVTKPTETGSYSSSIDLGISYALRALLINIFSKCKLLGYENTLKDCYDIIGNWIFKNYIPDNYKHLSKILSAMGSCDANLSFEIILPKLIGKIVNKNPTTTNSSLIKNRDEDEYSNIVHLIKTEIEDESYLLYYVNLISSLIRYTQDHLLSEYNKQYYFIIASLINNLFLDSRSKVRRSGIKLQQRFIESLVCIQIIEIGENYPVIYDPEKITLSILLWGFPFYSQEKTILNQYQRPKWYVPNYKTLNEIKSMFIFNSLIVLKILIDTIDKNKVIFPDNSSENNDLLKNLYDYYDNEIKNSKNPLYIRLLNEKLNSDEQSKAIKKNSIISSLFFCLNNMRILNKSISTLFPCIKSETFKYSESEIEINSLAMINKELSDEFEPFFLKYYQDCYQIILFLSEVFFGIKIIDVKLEFNNNINPDYYYKLVNPTLIISNTEEIKFKTKLIKATNQFLNHYYSSTSNLSLSSLYNTDFSESVLSWLSFTNGLFFQSSMINSPRIFWLKNIQYHWNKRINFLRHQYMFSGDRKKLVYLISIFSLGNYHMIRKSAQSTLKEALNSHISSRNTVLQFIFFEVFLHVLSLQIKEDEAQSFFENNKITNSNPNSESFEMILSSNIKFLISNIQNNKNNNEDNQISEKAQNIEEYIFNHLSGLSFLIVNNTSFQRLLWNNFELLLQYFIMCSYFSSLKLSKENVHVRLLNSLNFVINNRDFKNLLFFDKFEDSSVNKSIFQIKLNKLFQQFVNIKIYEDVIYIQKINSSFICNKNKSISVVLDILLIILSELDSIRINLFNNTTCIRKSLTLLILIQGIINNAYNSTLNMKNFISLYWNYLWNVMLDSNKFNHPNFYSIVLHNLTILIDFLIKEDMSLLKDLIINNKIFNKTNINLILNNMVNISNQASNCLNLNQSSTSSRTDRKLMNSNNTGLIINNIASNYNSTLNSFPYHRIKCYSNNLSLTNIIFFQQIFLILFIEYQNEKADKNNDCINSILEILIDWCNKTNINIEKEKHLIILEVISSLFSISTYSDELDKFLVNNINKDKLINILFSEFQQSDQDFIFNYMDCIKCSLTPLSRLNLEYYYNKKSNNLINSPITNLNKILLNFILNPFNFSMNDNNDNNLLTFELIKYLRIYQSGLIELIMNNNDNLGQEYIFSSEFENYFNKGLNIFCSIILKDNNYKQLREEISNMLHTMVLSCNLIYSSIDQNKLTFDYKLNLIEKIKSIIFKLNEDIDLIINNSKNEINNVSSEIVNKIILKIEIILYYCLLKDLYSNNKSLVKIDDIFPFEELFNLINKLQIINNNNDISGLSYNSLMSILLIQSNFYDLLEEKLFKIVNKIIDPQNLKCRLFQIRVNTIIGEFYSLIINGSKLQLEIINNVIYGFFEDQPEIKYISKQAFCTLFRTLSASRSVNYIKMFISWINSNQSFIEENNHYFSLLNIKIPEFVSKEVEEKRKEKLRNAGILGLISIILSHPFDIPFWLPETITFLANCSVRDISQNLKKQIQECIQEFLKTHQDGWNIVHKHKFKPYQLEIIDTYKGRPTYFT